MNPQTTYKQLNLHTTWQPGNYTDYLKTKSKEYHLATKSTTESAENLTNKSTDHLTTKSTNDLTTESTDHLTTESKD